MDRSLIEVRVRKFILSMDYQKLIYLDENDRRVWRLIQSNLYQTDETLRWHAIEAVAAFMRRWWDNNRQEKVLDYMRRLMWTINDESGGIGWSTPQTIAEIVVAIPQVGEPFINNMINRTFNEPFLRKSGLWAIGRLGQRVKQSIEIRQDDILPSSNTYDPETLGLAAWAVGEIGLKSALPYLKFLQDRKEMVRIYIPPNFHNKQVKSWYRLAIKNICQNIDIA